MAQEQHVLTEEQVAAVFTEWMYRYEEEPETFAEEYGPAAEYGPGAAAYFVKLVTSEPDWRGDAVKEAEEDE